MAYLQANAEEIWLEVVSTAKRLALENPRERYTNLDETDIDALIGMKLCEMRRLGALRSTTQLSH